MSPSIEICIEIKVTESNKWEYHDINLFKTIGDYSRYPHWSMIYDSDTGNICKEALDIEGEEDLPEGTTNFVKEEMFKNNLPYTPYAKWITIDKFNNVDLDESDNYEGTYYKIRQYLNTLMSFNVVDCRIFFLCW